MMFLAYEELMGAVLGPMFSLAPQSVCREV